MSAVRTSAKALIIRDRQLLCTLNRGWLGDDYLLLPGGGQRHGENLLQALRRECLEELGAHVRPGPLRYVRDYIGANHAFKERHAALHQVECIFICELEEEPHTHPPSSPDLAQLSVVWIPLQELPARQIFPSVLKQLITPDGQLLGDIYLGDAN